MNGFPERQRSESAPNAKVPILTEKRCTKCQKIKPIKNFFIRKRGVYDSWCKECAYKSTQKWIKNNPEKARKVRLLWRKNNPEKIKSWAMLNKERIYKKKALWYKNNPEKVKVMRQKSRIKVRNTLKGRLKHNMSVAIWQSLKNNKGKCTWETLVGYTTIQLKRHLEKLFKLGMSWNNYGKNGWEVDHVVPISAFNFEKPEDDDFKRCWALKNLRPLLVYENRSKSNKIDKHFQPSLIFK